MKLLQFNLGTLVAISSWLKENIKERIPINEFLGEMDRSRPRRVILNSKRIERKEKKEEIKKKTCGCSISMKV
jgi:hypothetical protein